MKEFENRVIPVLTITGDKLVKTIKFRKPNYIGDPVNAVKIFNEKMVDEIILLDITASVQKRAPNYAKIEEICSEAFMPFAYGGGIQSLQQVDLLFQAGIEKVVLNSILSSNLNLVKEIGEKYGAQSVIASIDVKKGFLGNYQVSHFSGKKKSPYSLKQFVKKCTEAGVGEIFINSIDRDGTYEGYDTKLIQMVTDDCEVPVIACGGAGKLEDFSSAIEHGASAVAAGSLFVYSKQNGGILITYPSNIKL